MVSQELHLNNIVKNQGCYAQPTPTLRLGRGML